MSFPPATEMFQFAGFASHGYGFTVGSPRREGLPHSDISGSTSARLSPELFAACHVLHRLSVPRHPPNALLLSSLTLSPKRVQHTSRKTCAPPPEPSIEPHMPRPRSRHQHTHARTRPIDRTRSDPNGRSNLAAVSPVASASRSRLASRCQNHRSGAGRRPVSRPCLAPSADRLPDMSSTSHASFERGASSLVGLGRFERPTSRLSGVRSNQLSYRPASHKPTRHKLETEGIRRRRPVGRPGHAGAFCQKNRSSSALERR